MTGFSSRGLPALLVVAMGGGCGRATPPARTTIAPARAAVEAARREVQAVLAHGAAAWNRGDLEGFLSDYAPDATFVTRDSVLYGLAEIRARYAARFAPGGVRDSLSFQGLEVNVLAPDALNAIAYYVLQRGDSVTARGPTSLVMRRRDGRWLIVHDHSS
jgi:uncharacterized protein (TIGR02246 family)